MARHEVCSINTGLFIVVYTIIGYYSWLFPLVGLILTTHPAFRCQLNTVKKFLIIIVLIVRHIRQHTSPHPTEYRGRRERCIDRLPYPLTFAPRLQVLVSTNALFYDYRSKVPSCFSRNCVAVRPVTCRIHLRAVSMDNKEYSLGRLCTHPHCRIEAEYTSLGASLAYCGLSVLLSPYNGNH
ncbi:hypothetical protein F4775DRAFT_229778 [Biscogniauxia sp. FL1348]|nr:hypothetical protein F4775DRAFT_229778 [Biscogniauxia sp. FL1348]